tara:strand:+ start:573 stop:869 length:297 start_codon:yes stop_codon:yes gene_type:complete
MSKKQVITIEKEGSGWANANECISELSLAIKDSGISNNFEYEKPATIGKLKEQTYCEERLWDNDKYVTYKANLSTYESAINEALAALGWTISDTVTDG